MRMQSKFSGSGAHHVGPFGRPTIFMNKEGEGGGGGGGGGSGGGGDDEDKKFEERFNRYFHKAMGEREKRFETRLMKNIDQTFSTKLNELKEAILAEDDDTGGSGGEGGSGGDGKPKGGQSDLSPETRAALKRAEDTAKEAKEKAEKWEREAKAASDKARRNEERGMLVTSLSGKVKPALIDMVVDQLHGKHVVRDEDDPEKILWKTANGELLPFKDGLDSWIKSDSGKEVAPPVPARGSGGRGGSGGVDGKGEMTMEGLGNIISGSVTRPQ